MNSSELNAWRDELYLSFGSIREAKQYFGMMSARYELASQKVDELLDESKANMKGELKPIYLHRSSDSAARSLKWKLSAAKCFGFTNAARAISLLSEDVISILRNAEGVSDELIRDVVEIDFKRCYLNYALNYSYHEMKRVELFIEEFESWRKLPRLLNENYS